MIRVSHQKTLHGHTQAIYALCRYSDHQFFSAGGDGKIVIWDIARNADGKLLADTPEIIFCMAFQSFSNRLMCGTMSGGVYLLDTKSRQVLINTIHHRGGTYAVLAVGNTMISAGADGIVTVWDPAEGKVIQSIKCSDYGIRSLVSGSGGYFFTGDQGGNIHVISSEHGMLPQRVIPAHQQTVFSMAYDKPAGKLYTGSRDAKLKKWAVEKEQLTQQIEVPAHWFTINSVANLEGMGAMATASRDKSIRIWDKRNLTLMQSLYLKNRKGHSHSVNHLLWYPNSGHLISCSDDRSINIWRIEKM